MNERIESAANREFAVEDKLRYKQSKVLNHS